MNLEINFEIGKDLKNEVLNSISVNELRKIFDLILQILNEEWKKIEKTSNCHSREGGNLLINKSSKFISLNFISDEEIKNLNKESRWKDNATDCLSFPYEPEDFIPTFWEVFIAMPYIQKQAEEYWNSLKNEIIKMFIHSVLHLFWYDHQNDEEFEEMNKIEKKLYWTVLYSRPPTNFGEIFGCETVCRPV